MSAKQINLLPRTDLADSAFGKLLAFSLTYGRYIIVGTQLIVLLAFFSRFKLDRELTDLQDAIEQKEAIVQSLADFESEIRLLQNRIGAIKELKDKQELVQRTLLAMKTVLPPGNALVNLRFKEDKISIAGISQNEQSLAALLNQINTSDYFSAVEIERINKHSDSDKIDFSLTMSLQ